MILFFLSDAKKARWSTRQQAIYFFYDVSLFLLFFHLILLCQHLYSAPVQRDIQKSDQDFSDELMKNNKNQLSQDQREFLWYRYRRWKSLDLTQKENINQNLKQYDEFSPRLKNRLRAKWYKFNKLSSSQRKAIIKKYAKWKTLSLAQKQQLRQRYQWLKKMSSEEKKQLFKKKRLWDQISPAQQQTYRDEYYKKLP